MEKIIKQTLGLTVLMPFILSIFGWFQGWEITYRPIPNAPIISPYTSLVFIILFFNKVSIKQFNLSSFTLSKIRVFSLGLTVSILFLELAIHTNGASQFLALPMSSTATILTFFLLCVLEVVSLESEENSLLVDALFLVSLFWVYLSICGHIFGEIVLTGISNNVMIGLSLPTACAFLLYLAILIKDDSASYTKKLFKSVSWAKKYIFVYTAGFLILPLIFITLLKNVLFEPEDHFKIFLSFTLIGMFFITLFIVLIHFLSKTHSGIQLICTYTKRIKTPDGEWMPIERYLTLNYGLDLKHTTSEEAKRQKELKKSKQT
ncbi:hypothetical protein [Halobacteriovorax sp.]|uniref:hypothetical protein n=1 Tax=Halobacteriovorax sp. TaxID=2020862 RepID=UPI00356A9FD4